MWRSATLSSCSTCLWFFAAIFGRQTWYRVVSFTWAFCQGSCPPSGFVASGAWPLSESFEGLDGFEQVLPYRGWTSHHFFFRLLSATAGGSLPARWTMLDKSPLLLSTSFSYCWWLFAGAVDRGWTSHHFFFQLLSATAGGSLPAWWWRCTLLRGLVPLRFSL